MNQEQPNQVNIHAEPVAPSVDFVTHADIRVQGDRQREQDRADYFKDIEDRRQRGKETRRKAKTEREKGS
jgi:hypothetical protein